MSTIGTTYQNVIRSQKPFHETGTWRALFFELKLSCFRILHGCMRCSVYPSHGKQTERDYFKTSKDCKKEKHLQRVPISWELNWARLFQNLEGLQKRKALSGTLYNQRVTTSFWYFVFVFVFAWLMYVHRMSRPKAKRRSASILIECLCFKASSSSYKRSQNSLKENLTATHWLLSFLFACTFWFLRMR